MARVEVSLLGRPAVRIDGAAVAPPRGAKSWALLAYLATTGRPCARTELAELPFGRAQDPLGALRWSLAALRRALAQPQALAGDPVELGLHDTVLDVVQLEAGDPGAALVAGGELLAGMAFPDCPVFELWLGSERHRLARRSLSLLRETSVGAFARGDGDLAVEAARRLVVAEPFDEGHHALLIRTLALTGQHEAARSHFDECVELLEAELRCEPGPAVLAAVQLVRPHPVVAQPGYEEVCARIDVGWQSFLAGSIDHGIDMGRSGVTLAEAHGDVVLRVAARLFLAGMLGIAVRGWDEVATVTSEAAHLAVSSDRHVHAARARAIRAGNELMRGDYEEARAHATAGAALSDDPDAVSLNLSFLAAVEGDTGDAGTALALVDRAVADAERTGDAVTSAYAHAYRGHLQILVGSPDAGRASVERAIDACSSVLVLKPWPMAMLAEIDLRAGRVDDAARTARVAEGLATATGISYQKALARRALALVAAAEGDDEQAVEHLSVALAEARRTAAHGYAFHWPVAWVLESLAVVSARIDESEGRRWAEVLRDHAAGLGMTTFSDRAARLGAAAR